MRVLQLIDSLDAGGAERVAVTYANALCKRIDRSFLCTTRKEGLLKDSIDENVEFLFLKKKHTLDIFAIFRLLKYVKQHGITIIHAHATSFFTATLVKLLYPKIVLIWHDHYGNSEMLEERSSKILKWCSGKFGAIICVNDELVDWAKKQLRTNDVHFLRNAVSLSSETSSKEIELKGEEGKRIVCLANLRPQKDHKNLITAFEIIAEKHQDHSLHLFGQNWNDDYFREIQKLMEDSDVKDRIHYYGSHPNVANILDQCDIGVLSSRSEGLPLTLLEYGFAGLAVVCTDVGQCAEVVLNDDMIVKSGDPKQLAKAINHYIGHQNQMKEDARSFHDHIEKKYSLNIVIPRLISIYRDCF